MPTRRHEPRVAHPAFALTSISIGKRVGEQPYGLKGKNDGSVQGVQYFTCPMGYGEFVRPSQVKAVLGMEPKEPRENGTPVRVLMTGRVSHADTAQGRVPVSRPGLGHQRTPSSSSLLRSNSMHRSTASTSNSPRSSSPAKVSPKPASPVKTSRLGPGSPAKRASISLQPRKSLSLKHSPPGHEPSLSREPSGSRRPPASPVLSRHQTSSPLITQTPLLATTPPRTPSPPIPTIRPGSRSSSPINNATVRVLPSLLAKY